MRSKSGTEYNKASWTTRILTIAAGVVILVLLNYGYGITNKRITVLENGSIRKTTISRISVGRKARTFFAIIDSREYDLGSVIPQRPDIMEGDTITVRYVPEIEYAVPVTITSFARHRILQLIGLLAGLFCIIVGIINPGNLGR